MTNRTITSESPYKICFVCLGNICRSPTAEGIFQHLVNTRNLEQYFYIDSAGTSAYHIGEPANSNSRKTARKHGIELKSRARRFEPADLKEFDLILAMDDENYQNLIQMDTSGNDSGKIKKLRDFDPDPEDGNIPDPYYGGTDGFENVYRIVFRSCESLLSSLRNQIHEM